MNARLQSFDQIQNRASAIATSAMRSDYWLNTQVRGLETNDPGHAEDLLDKLYPEAQGHLETTSLPAIVAAESIAASLEFWEKHTAHHDESIEADIGSISRGFVGLVEADGAQYFEVSDLNCPCDRRYPEQRIHHPFAKYTYWTYWLLAIDRANGRAISLAIAASD